MATAAEVASVYGILDLRDNASNKLKKAEGNFAGFADSMERVGGGISRIGTNLTLATAPISLFGATGLRAASDFEASLNMISARTGLVGADLQNIADFAIQMGADTVFSAQQASDAFLELLSSGSTTAEAMAQLPSVLNLAAAGSLDLKRSADLVTDVMAIYNLEADEAARVTDALARAAASSSADVGQLGDGFIGVGGKAQQMGISVEETAAILAIFAESGIKGSEAGTQLRSMLTNMTRTTEKTTGAWNELGVELYDAEGNLRNLDTILNETRTAMNDLPMEDQIRLSQDIAGSYGILGFTALLSSDGIAAMNDKMNDQASASSVAAMQMTSFRQTVNSLMGSIQALQITAMTPFMENTLKPGIVTVKDFVNELTLWAQANPELTNQIVKIGAALVVLGPTLVVIGQAVTLVAGAMQGFALLMGLAAAPVVLLTAAIVGLLFAFQQLYPGGLAQMFMDATVAAQMLSAIFMFGLVQASEAVRGAISQQITNWNLLLIIITTLWQRGGQAIQQFSDNVVAAFQPMLDMINSLIDKMETLLGKLAAAREAGAQIGQIGGYVASGQVGPGVVAGAIWNEATGGGNYYGGPVTGMTRVGEYDTPELFQQGGKQYLIPGDRGRVIPGSAMGGGGGPSITVNVFGNDAYDLGELVERQLRDRGY